MSALDELAHKNLNNEFGRSKNVSSAQVSVTDAKFGIKTNSNNQISRNFDTVEQI